MITPENKTSHAVKKDIMFFRRFSVSYIECNDFIITFTFDLSNLWIYFAIIITSKCLRFVRVHILAHFTIIICNVL